MHTFDPRKTGPRHEEVAEHFRDFLQRIFPDDVSSRDKDEALRFAEDCHERFGVDSSAVAAWVRGARSLGDLVAPLVVYPEEKPFFAEAMHTVNEVLVDLWPNAPLSTVVGWTPYEDPKSRESLSARVSCKLDGNGEGLRLILWKLRQVAVHGQISSHLDAVYYYPDFSPYQRIVGKSERPKEYDAPLGMRSLLEVPLIVPGHPLAVLILYSPILNYLRLNGDGRLILHSVTRLATRSKLGMDLAILTKFAEEATEFTGPEPKGINTDTTYLRELKRRLLLALEGPGGMEADKPGKEETLDERALCGAPEWKPPIGLGDPLPSFRGSQEILRVRFRSKEDRSRGLQALWRSSAPYRPYRGLVYGLTAQEQYEYLRDSGVAFDEL